MSDYSTYDEGLGGTALVVAAVIIGLFIIALAFIGSNATSSSADGAAALEAPLETPAAIAPVAVSE